MEKYFSQFLFFWELECSYLTFIFDGSLIVDNLVKDKSLIVKFFPQNFESIVLLSFVPSIADYKTDSILIPETL